MMEDKKGREGEAMGREENERIYSGEESGSERLVL